MHPARRLIPLLALCAACASAPQTGIMAGRWTPKGGVDAQSVPFSWNSHHENHGVIHTTLGKGGEHFNGQFVLVESSTSGPVVETIYSDWYAPAWAELDWDTEGNLPGEGVELVGFVHHYTGKVLATLFGNDGRSMRCQLTLNDPRRGMVGGGIGECQVSDGSAIDVQF
jgi:hypothetical protein